MGKKERDEDRRIIEAKMDAFMQDWRNDPAVVAGIEATLKQFEKNRRREFWRYIFGFFFRKKNS